LDLVRHAPGPDPGPADVPDLARAPGAPRLPRAHRRVEGRHLRADLGSALRHRSARLGVRRQRRRHRDDPGEHAAGPDLRSHHHGGGPPPHPRPPGELRTVRAITYEAPETVAVSEVADAVLLDEHAAVVQVTAAGICGSDLHIYGGH